MRSSLQSIARQLLNQLMRALPSSCALCGASGDAALCAACAAQFFQVGPARCRQCALPLPHAAGADRCGACQSRAPAFDATIAAADYAAPVDQLVLGLKFAGRLALAPLCARLLRDAILREPRQSLPTLLLAVPLGERRLAARGFNQALEIARPLSRSLGIFLDAHLALRDKETAAQSLLHPDARQHNMHGAFGLQGGANLRGQHVGVVDDVMTTGATLQEMALMLKRHGAARVTNFVFVRTLPK
jgi:ComF family protein